MFCEVLFHPITQVRYISYCVHKTLKHRNNKARFFTVNNNNYYLQLQHLPVIKGQCFIGVISFWVSWDGHNKREKKLCYRKKQWIEEYKTRCTLVCIYLVISLITHWKAWFIDEWQGRHIIDIGGCHKTTMHL